MVVVSPCDSVLAIRHWKVGQYCIHDFTLLKSSKSRMLKLGSGIFALIDRHTALLEWI